MRNPAGGRGSQSIRHSDLEPFSPGEPSAQLLQLRRRLLRKIAIEPTATGWRARIVGFDPRFFSASTSRDFATRAEAIAAAVAASRVCGIPVITAESLTAGGGPERAA